jgi:hypothetical protein
MTIDGAQDEAPFRRELRQRRLAAEARRALRSAGVDSVAALRAMPRADLLRMPGLGPHGYDFVNDLLNGGDEAGLADLIATDPATSTP